MRIGALIKHSLIDWEGRVAAVIFTRGCNFRCGYCHNPLLVLPELYRDEPNIPINDVLAHLESRKEWLDGVVISGGEPTIHTDLEEFIRTIHTLGLPVKLDTNGTNPGMLKRLINQHLVDFVAMDIKHLPRQDCYARVTGVDSAYLLQSVLESIEILKTSSIGYLFRTTLIPGIHGEKAILELQELFRSCPFILQPFRDGQTVGSTSP
jgi:pyruvate formate lyase activating enzyme